MYSVDLVLEVENASEECIFFDNLIILLRNFFHFAVRWLISKTHLIAWLVICAWYEHWKKSWFWCLGTQPAGDLVINPASDRLPVLSAIPNYASWRQRKLENIEYDLAPEACCWEFVCGIIEGEVVGKATGSSRRMELVHDVMEGEIMDSWNI